MISRLPINILSVALAFTIVTACWAAPDAPGQTATADTAAYIITNQNQQVTIKDETGKTLLTCRAATPTIQAIMVKNAVGTGNSPADKNVLYQFVLTLEDQNGLRLWSTLVPIVSPMTFGVKTNTDVKNTRLEFAHSTEHTSASDDPTPSRVTVLIGADGRPTLLKADDKDFKFVYGPNGFTLTDPDGKDITGSGSPKDFSVTGPEGNIVSMNLTDTGGMLNLNGTQIPVEKVTKDGKDYLSFPWNGHKVLIEGTCTFTVSTDGDLTVNAPSASK